uniref:DREB45 n=1 Tax=Arundo donax TaxID=35708 RepID=A0A0A8YVH2_ARUDO
MSRLTSSTSAAGR